MYDFFVSGSRRGMLYLVTLLSRENQALIKYYPRSFKTEAQILFQHSIISDSNCYGPCKTALHFHSTCWSSRPPSYALCPSSCSSSFLRGTQLILHDIACTCLYIQFIASNANKYAHTLFCPNIDPFSIGVASLAVSR